MIRRLIRSLLTLNYYYEDPVERQRARVLIYTMLAGFLFSLVSASSAVLALVRGAPLQTGIILSIAAPLISMVVYALTQTGRLTTAVYTLIALLLGISLSAIGGTNSQTGLLSIILPTVFAGLLRSWRTVAVVFLVSTVFISVNAFLTNQLPVQTNQLVIFTLTHGLIALMLVFFSGNLRETLSDYLQQINNMRRVAGVSAEFGVEVSEEEYVRETINILRDDIGYGFAQLFLVEAGDVRERIATALNTAQVNTYRDVDLSRQSAIYETIRNNETVIVTDSDSELRRDHLLPGVAVGIALPVRGGDEIIGVLDVQREGDSIFSSLEIEELQIVAGRLGNALAITRYMQVLRGDISDQQALINQLRERLREYERAEEEMTIGAWSSYLQRRGVESLGYDYDDGHMNRVEGVPEDIQSALETGDISIDEEGDDQLVRVPITLRGQTLGAMAFRVPKGNQTIGPRQKELMNSVVQRLGLALENKRLFEQSQSQAQRERKANEVGSTLLSTTDIETVLQLAADNFNEALGAVQTRIYLQPEANSDTEETP